MFYQIAQDRERRVWAELTVVSPEKFCVCDGTSSEPVPSDVQMPRLATDSMNRRPRGLE
jgi:hypothetical protein